ncbi:Ulp1 protease family, C-terminal catalytic domain containing protein [Trema orientale]|uniref:Ulp1 protease family, C-terminal catalytic domain containing protein n=1 Tax=Trema orientale TaxID=63057 RepID=A0A2P5EXM2_TREOI|nr:Ulp1 protease family, C-terminal catalytic domain containing protein [Trema orientale]
MVNDDSFETVSSKDEKVAGVEGIDSHVDIEKDIASNQFNKATDDGFSAKSDDDSQCNIDIGSSQSVSSNEKRVEKVLDAIGNNYRDSLYVWDAVKCKESTVVLNGWEILVATDLVIVRQFHLMSLKANEVVDSRDLIKIVGSIFRAFQMGFMGWTTIYLPIIQDNYWFIAIVKLKENVVHVFDSLQIPTLAIGLAIVDDLGLDFIFKKEISLSMPVGWTSKDFIVIKGDHIPLCSKAEESGIYVMKLMQSAYSTEKICENGTEIDERNSLAFQLTMSVHNRRRSFLNATIIDSTRF